jgi:hypothetical protein
MSSRAKTITILTTLLVAVLVISGTALADNGIPPFPSFYSGTVYVGGSQAGAGLKITNSILDWSTETGYEGITDENGYYELAVAPTDSECVGETIYFYINGGRADETAIFLSDKTVTNFDLHIDALPTATPTDANASTTVPTPTSTEGTAEPTEPAEPTTTTPAASTTPRTTPTATSTPPPTPASEGGLGWGAVAGIGAVALVLGVATALMLSRMSARKAARRSKKSPPPQR